MRCCTAVLLLGAALHIAAPKAQAQAQPPGCTLRIFMSGTLNGGIVTFQRVTKTPAKAARPCATAIATMLASDVKAGSIQSSNEMRDLAVAVAQDARQKTPGDSDYRALALLAQAINTSAQGLRNSIATEHSADASWSVRSCRAGLVLLVSAGTPRPVTAQFNLSCDGPPPVDATLQLSFDQEKRKPGEGGILTATVVDPAGNPLPLQSAVSTGFGAIGAGGEPAAIINAGTAMFTYTVATPRRDDEYRVTVRVVADAPSGSIVLSGTASLEVLNVAPYIVSVEGSAEAAPGETMRLVNARVVVVDENADARNRSELDPRRVSTIHPTALSTIPATAFENIVVRQESFNAALGQYTFVLSGSGSVMRPHRARNLAMMIRVSDEGETVQTHVPLSVREVAPVLEFFTVSPNQVLNTDPARISVQVRLSDRNGTDDFQGVTLDARAAGGIDYNLMQLDDADRGPEFIAWHVPPFSHTAEVGEHPIVLAFSDGVHSGSATRILSVTAVQAEAPPQIAPNLPPTIGITGYTYEARPGRRLVSPRARVINLCPGDPLDIGVTAFDPENDDLTVTATLLPGGTPIPLLHTSGRNFIGSTVAPAPGKYIIRYEARETHGNNAAQPLEDELIVPDCGQRQRTASPPVIRVAEGSTQLTPPALASAANDPSVQVFLATIPNVEAQPESASEGALLWPNGGATRERFMSLGPGDATFGTIALHARTPVLTVDELLEGGARLYLTSTGTSTGKAFGIRVENGGRSPVSIRGGTVVLEPVLLRREARAAVVSHLERLAAKNPVLSYIDGYCLEFLRGVPEPGRLFRIAGKELQERFEPARQVLDVVNDLKRAGLLNPDSDPEDYYHSIVQWSLWSMQERFDQAGFASAFVEHTRKNLTESGTQWTPEVGKLVRDLVPNRWSDIRKVLARSGVRVP
jgi:hypothetical protein